MSEFDELVKKLRVLAEVAPQKAAYAIELLVHERDKLKWSMEWYEDRAEKAESEVERLKGVLEFVDLNISKDNEAAKAAIRAALEAKP